MKVLAALLLVTFACSGDDDSPESPATGEQEGSPEGTSSNETSESESEPDPRIELPNPAFEVVPQRSMRGINRVEFMTPHRAAVTNLRGEVAIVDIPSGHVRVSRRVFRSLAEGAQASADGNRVWLSGSEGGERYELAWKLDTDELVELRVVNPDDGMASDPELRHFATVSPPYEEYDEYEDYEDEYGEDEIENEDDQDDEVEDESDSGIVLFLQSFSEDSTRHQVGDTVEEFHDVFFSSDGTALLIHDQLRMHRYGLDGRHQRTFEVPPVQDVRHASTGDRFAHVDDDTVQVRSSLDGSVAHSFEVSDVDTFRWTSDGRILTCAGSTLRIHSGETHDQVTEHEVEDCKVDNIDARGDHVGVFIENPPRYQRLGEESFELTGSRRFVPPRGRYFLMRDQGELHIVSIDRRRSRRLMRGGAGEYSAWGATILDDAIVMSGRDWSYRAGSADPESARERVQVNDGPDVGLVSMAADQQRALVGTRERERLWLYSVTGNKLVRGLSDYVSCFEAYEEETGDEYWACQAQVTWRPGGFVVRAQESALSFDNEGRRLGRLSDVRSVTASGDWLVVVRKNGAVVLADARLRVEQAILPPRDAFALIVTHDNFIAAKRGNAVVVFDTTTGAPRFALEVNEDMLGIRFTSDGMLLLGERNSFRWFDPRTGEEMRKIELEGVVAMTPDRSKALVCVEERLHVRVLEEDQPGRDLGPCDHSYGHFDGEFAWTHGATRGHFLRVSDGARLTVGVLHQRRMLGFAYTPQGHVWLSRPPAVWAIRVRLPGSIMTATTVRPRVEQVHATLVADFLAGRPLGDPPSWEESSER